MRGRPLVRFSVARFAVVGRAGVRFAALGFAVARFAALGFAVALFAIVLFAVVRLGPALAVRRLPVTDASSRARPLSRNVTRRSSCLSADLMASTAAAVATAEGLRVDGAGQAVRSSRRYHGTSSSKRTGQQVLYI